MSSAVAGAATVLAAQLPDRSTRVREVADAVLALPSLRDTGSYESPAGATVMGQFRRRGCCLLYLVPSMSLCQDCVLVDRAGASTPPPIR